jgi:hypothetical protein
MPCPFGRWSNCCRQWSAQTGTLSVPSVRRSVRAWWSCYGAPSANTILGLRFSLAINSKVRCVRLRSVGNRTPTVTASARRRRCTRRWRHLQSRTGGFRTVVGTSLLGGTEPSFVWQSFVLFILSVKSTTCGVLSSTAQELSRNSEPVHNASGWCHTCRGQSGNLCYDGRFIASE